MEQIAPEIKEYIKSIGVDALLADICKALYAQKPADPRQFIRSYLENTIQLRDVISEGAKTKSDDGEPMETEEEEPDHESHEPEIDTQNRYAQNRKMRRGAISSEPVDMGDLEDQPFKATSSPKSPETQRQLEESVKNNLLFAHLELEERAEVFNAMEKIECKAGEVIIKQGDEGDYFYILDEGECEIFKQEGTAEPKLVMTVRQWDCFGELALIYNTPRAATVKAKTSATVWRIDRITYRRIIMGAQMRKRKLYDSFLEKVPILATLQKYERLTVADALEPATFTDGEVIIRQGEPGNTFYIIVEGEVQVTKTADTGAEVEVARLGGASYFGEIALLTNRPRAATVRSVGQSKCVKLDRDRFVRVMGPCEDILRRNMSVYNQYMSVNI